MNERGSILLNISLIIFIISAVAAAYTAWRLRNLSSLELPDFLTAKINSYLPEESPAIKDSQNALAEDPLMPEISLTPALTAHRETLNTRLISPLRSYYATQPQQLRKIIINSSEQEDFPAAISLTLTNKEEIQNVEFMYGEKKDGQPVFPDWTPSMFDNTP